jgi:hypothetical protein
MASRQIIAFYLKDRTRWLVNKGNDYRGRPNYNRNTSHCKRARKVQS